MPTAEGYDFDFAVAGGGPAGTSAAISLAQRGRSVVLFERETFPRFHIGESLLATANDAFVLLGVAERMEAAGFPKKWGASLITHDGASGRGVDFSTAHGIVAAADVSGPARGVRPHPSPARKGGRRRCPRRASRHVLRILIGCGGARLHRGRRNRRTRACARDRRRHRPAGTDREEVRPAYGRAAARQYRHLLSLLRRSAARRRPAE